MTKKLFFAVTLLCMTTSLLAQERRELASDEVSNSAAAEVPLKIKVYRNWSIRLPDERWKPIGRELNLSAGLGANFKAHLEGTTLAVDIDADGKIDVKVDEPGGHLILVHDKMRYAVRVKKVQQIWHFAPASAMSGKVAGTRIRLIDQNNNGRFDDYGVDAMVVGNGKVASLLSKVVAVDGKLIELKVAANGQSLTCSPFLGPSAKLNLKALTKGKVLAAVIKSRDGQYSFGVDSNQNDLVVPAGQYDLHSGTISFGGNSVQMRKGSSKGITVKADAQAVLTWGGPVRAEFAYAKRGRELQFDFNQIRYFGKSGEEYHSWQPIGKSPKISLHDKSGREIAQAFFPGSC